MTHTAQHIACDGCGIAKDDLREIEMLHRRDEILKELFQNASRIRKSMRGNAWLRPIFRKYKRTCRDILDQKNKEAVIFAQIADYEYDPTDLKLIQTELNDIHSQIKSLEEMRMHDSSSSSDLSSSSSESEPHNNSESSSECDNDEADNQSISSDSSSSLSSSSSSSSSSEDMDIEDFL